MIALLTTLACAPTAPIELTAQLSEEMPTVIELSWRTDSDQPGTVEFGTDLSAPLVATAERQDDGSWRALLVGLPADSEARYRVRHGDLSSEAHSTWTDSAPAWVPDAPEVTGVGKPGFLVTGARSEDGKGAVILDDSGRPVWWASIEDYGRDTYTSRAVLDHARENVWISLIGSRFATASADLTEGVLRVPLGGGEPELIALPDHHHDLYLHEDGSIAYLAAYTTELEGAEVEVDTVMLRSADGSTTELWSTLDLLGPELDHAWLNTIEYEAYTDSYWVGSRGLSTIFQLDAQTGAVLSTLGGPDADLTTDLRLNQQHGFDIVGDQLVVFNNGAVADGDSRGMRFELDDDRGVATATLSHGADPAAYSSVLGDALDLGDGATLMNWTTHGLVHQLDADGQLVAEWVYDDFDMFAYMRRVDRIVR